jgi:hypothetical protein
MLSALNLNSALGMDVTVQPFIGLYVGLLLVTGSGIVEGAISGVF